MNQLSVCENHKKFSEMTKLAKKTRNKGALRSQRLLTEAFFEILSEKPAKRIKVTALCDRAGVSTPTFYAHYQTIEEIPYYFYVEKWLTSLTSFLDDLINDDIPAAEINRRTSEWVLEYWIKEIETYKCLKAAGMEGVLLRLFRIGTKEAILRVVSENPDNLPESVVEYVMAISSNIMFTTFDHWVKTGKGISSQEVLELMSFVVNWDSFSNMIERYKDS